MCFSGSPVCPAADVYLSSVWPTRGTLQYVGDQHTLVDCCSTAELAILFSPKFWKEVIKLKVYQSFPQYNSLHPLKISSHSYPTLPVSAFLRTLLRSRTMLRVVVENIKIKT